MTSLADKLTASGGTESVGFLNDIVAQLWPNISIAGARMTKEIAEPMFATMLPGALSSLHFVKIDLGSVPMRFSSVDVHKTESEGIKLDMNLDWDGECDIELDGGAMIPKFGVEHVKLKGRLSVLLCPLTNVIPLIGAAQVAFINPPTLKLDFTDAANIADFGLIDNAVRKVILNIIASMAVLPNRFLVKLDANNDYFKTYQHQLGVIRLIVEEGTGFADPKPGKGPSFLRKLIKDVPDCYCKVKVSAEAEWKTSTRKNDEHPKWNETRDFIVTDHDQCIEIDVQDDDLAGDDDLGIGMTTVKKLLLAGGREELSLTHQGETTNAKLTLSGKYYQFVPDTASFTAEENQSDGTICGLVTILVAGAFGLQGQRDQLNPSVRVTWGDKKFQTPAKTDSPGMDIENPSFDTAFRIPLTADMVADPASFKFTLMNKAEEAGSVEIPFSDVVDAPDMVLQDKFEVGSGTTVRASICVRGTEVAE